jgi:hypothetical protein
MKKISQSIIILSLCLYPTFAISGTANFNDQILIVGSWGSKDGEFGRESLGKTELGHALEFAIYNDRIYILDSMNNRIQGFDLNGKFINKIPLNFDWMKQGVSWGFTVLKNHFFVLLSKPPSYSFMNASIYKISETGKILKEFGNTQLNKGKEEYFDKILGSDISGELYCSISGSSRIAVYDFNGNFIKYMVDVKSAPNILLNTDGKIRRDMPNYCRLVDRHDNCYKIWSNASARTNGVFSTHIEVFPPHSKTSDMITHEVSGDVKFAKDGKDQIVGYRGNFSESSFVDQDGAIYHMIALDDGVILRRLTWTHQ